MKLSYRIIQSGAACLAGLAVTIGASVPVASLSATREQPRPSVQVKRIYPHHARLRSNINFATPVQHVVVIVQENRTVDNLFQMYNLANVGQYCYQGTTMYALGQVTLAGQQVRNGIIDTMTPLFDPIHRHLPVGQPQPTPSAVYAPGSAFVADYDEQNGVGQNDNWDCEVSSGGLINYRDGAYVPPDEVKPYYDLAAKWGFSDTMFQGNEGPSFVAHQYLIAGQSGAIRNYSGGVPPPMNFGASENPGSGITDQPGCLTNPVPTLYLDYTQPFPGQETQTLTPCYDYKTIFDALPSPGPSQPPAWTYFLPTTDSIWNAPDDIRHLTGNSNIVIDPGGSKFQTAVQSATLPTLTYIIPCVGWSDHPAPAVTPNPSASGQNGPNWVNYIVNTIGQSPYWNSTTILVTWDDWGGFYDHVTPLHAPNYFNDPQDPNEFGYRVPLLVISPYLSHPGCTDHYPSGFQCVGRQIRFPNQGNLPIRSQGSILKYIETVFGLGTLGTQDAVSDDLSDMFNYAQAPMPFSTISPADVPPSPPFPAKSCAVNDILY